MVQPPQTKNCCTQYSTEMVDAYYIFIKKRFIFKEVMSELDEGTILSYITIAKRQSIIIVRSFFLIGLNLKLPF